MNRPRASRPRCDAGESLVELLISITIIGIGVVSILGAVMFTVDSSKLDQRQIHAQALLRSWGEFAVAQTTAATYLPCATASDYQSDPTHRWTYPTPTPPTGLEQLPAGFTAEITKVEYSNGTKFVSTCDAKYKVQRLELTITVSSTPAFASTYAVVVRHPCPTETSCIT